MTLQPGILVAKRSSFDAILQGGTTFRGRDSKLEAQQKASANMGLEVHKDEG